MSSSKKKTKEIDVDSLIAKLRDPACLKYVSSAVLSKEEVENLLDLSRSIINNQPILLELVGEFRICGDVHGQFSDLLRIFDFCGYPPQSNYLFLGDYVDRGQRSIETICLLLAYKIKYPENFFLLRGNHECSAINQVYGFFDECKRKYDVKLWKKFNDLFNCLPLAAIIEDKVFCVHGGLSPELDDLRSLDQINRIRRPLTVQDHGLACDLLWSDPDPQQQEWGPNDRGISYTFGTKIVDDFCKRFDIELIVRAHQVNIHPFLTTTIVVAEIKSYHYCYYLRI